MSLICSAALPPGFITTATVAADGMDFESPARPQGFVDKRTGEILQCADPDAGIGHRTARALAFVNAAPEVGTRMQQHEDTLRLC